MKKGIRALLSAGLLAACLISGTLLVRNMAGYRSGQSAYEDARAIAAAPAAVRETEQPPQTEGTMPPEPRTRWVPAPIEEEDPNIQALEALDLSALQQVNGDVLGWIRIPDTKVDYPLLQGEDNQFYLHSNWKKETEYVGSIFLECQNSPDLTDFNTIIYGHNMNNGSMFGSLRNYQYGDNWQKYPYVYILTGEGVLRYEVFSTYTAAVDSDTYGLSFRQEQTREAFIEMALEQSGIDTGIVPEPTDRILTLSTCSGAGYSTRRVVHARLKMAEVEES